MGVFKMEKESAISVKNLSIKYKSVGAYSIKRNLLHFKKVDKSIVEAVKNVSFEVNEGEILGIIGKNGSGKSTLLRAIANIFTPDEGSIDLHDRTISLLSIGVGFNGELTGRRNIMLSGLLLGFPEEVVKSKMDEIIEFSELGDFIDKPVRMYSSGMYSKLAFSITSTLETDIMLIDEVLSVGDERFKKKSYNKMKELIGKDNKTVVIVSHNTATLQELCDKVLWLHDGEIKELGDPTTVLDNYKKFMEI
jgi:teichoic acid transport system ATP-binding protein